MCFPSKYIFKVVNLTYFLTGKYFSKKFIRVGILFTCLISTSLTWSQSGNIFLKNYSPNINNKNISITQGNNGIMYFANSNGISSYDGKQWKHIHVPSIPRVLVQDSISKKIFVGCKKDFGYIDIDKTGKDVYTSISSYLANFENITNIIIIGESAYFYSIKRLFSYSTTKNTIHQILPPAWNDEFTGTFENNGVLFVNIEGKGLHQVKEDKLWPLNNQLGSQLAKQTILAAINLPNSSTLLYTNKNNCYIFNGQRLNSFKLQEQVYLKKNTVTAGIELSKNLFVLSTSSGGCVIIDKYSGKTDAIINYQTGLPDNEVYAVALDNLGGLWITHNDGITRVDSQLPITNFSSYPGLKGNLTDVIKFDNKLYVATTEGVFLLTKLQPTSTYKNPNKNNIEKCYTEEQIIIEVEKQHIPENIIRKTTSIFKNKSAPEKNEVKEIKTIETEKGKKSAYTINTQTVENQNNSQKQPYTYIQPHLQYSFKKIKGIDKKCHQLISCYDKLFAATSTDLYKIKNGKAKRIIKDKPINNIYVPINYHNQIYIGTDDGVLVYFLKKGKFMTRELGVNVTSIVEDNQFNLWVGGINQVFKFKMNAIGELTRQYNYLFPSDSPDYVKVRNIGGDLWFFANLDLYHYDSKRDKIFKDTLIKFNAINDNIIYSNNEYTWINSNLSWSCYTKNPNQFKREMKALNIINNIRHIYMDNEENCWVINSDNSLFKVTQEKIMNHKNSFLYISEAKNSNGELLTLDNFILEHDYSGVSFNITNPYYVNENHNQYQYHLAGVMNGWSPWSFNKKIDFPYLPHGRFKLYVRAKNIFGNIIESNGTEFSVDQPYWLKWWFYLIEIGSVFFLLALSLFFNKSKRSLFLSKSLMLLSIVIAFKLVQAIIESNISISPVADFLLSVILVFFILNAEKVIMDKLTQKTMYVKERLLLKKRKRMRKIEQND
jgi:ligand-binding sensor domain-containing protein